MSLIETTRRALFGTASAALARPPPAAAALSAVEQGPSRDRQSLRSELGLGSSLVPQENGCACDGTTDDAPALASLNARAAGRPIRLTGGALRIAASEVAINGPLIAYPGSGARFRVDGPTARLRLYGYIDAGPYPLFELVNGALPGQVVINDGTNPVCYAEWFGAAADGRTPSTVAIEAAHKAHPKVQLLGGGYLAPDLKLTESGHELVGLGWRRTFLFSDSPTGRQVTIGDPRAASPATSDDSIALRRVYVQRRGAPTDPGVGAELTALSPVGIETVGVIRCELDDVFVDGGMIGYLLRSTINTFGNRCYGSCRVPAGHRYFGMWLDGTATAEGAISSNASTKGSDLIVSADGPGHSTGFVITGAFSDQAIFRGETANTDVGVLIDGSALSRTDRRVVDMTLTGFVIDAYRQKGIVVRNTGPYSMIGFAGGYIAPSSGATGPMFEIVDAGMVSIDGDFQFVGWPRADVVGLSASNVRSLTVSRSVKMQDVCRPAMLEGIEAGLIAPSVFNTDARSASRSAFTCTRFGAELAPSINAETNGAFARGADIPDAGSGSTGFKVGVGGVKANRVTALLRLAGIVPTSNGLVAGGMVTGLVGGGLVIGGAAPTPGKLSVSSAAGGVSLALSDNTHSSVYVSHAPGGGAVIGTDPGGELWLAVDGVSRGKGMGVRSDGTLVIPQNLPTTPRGAGCLYKDANGFVRIG